MFASNSQGSLGSNSANLGSANISAGGGEASLPSVYVRMFTVLQISPLWQG